MFSDNVDVSGSSLAIINSNSINYGNVGNSNIPNEKPPLRRSLISGEASIVMKNESIIAVSWFLILKFKILIKLLNILWINRRKIGVDENYISANLY